MDGATIKVICKQDRKVITLNISAAVRMQILIFLCKEFPKGQKYETVDQ